MAWQGREGTMNRLDREEYEPPTVMDIEPIAVVMGGKEYSTLSLEEDC